MIPGFSNYITTQNIRQAQESLKSDLRTVQNKALTGVSSSDPTVSYWGLKVLSQNVSSYVFFKSSTNDGGACDAINAANANEIGDKLPGDVVVIDANGACVFFSLRNGDATIVNLGGSDIIPIGYAGEAPCHGVQINSAGIIRGVDTCP